jgi:transposase-like protein
VHRNARLTPEGRRILCERIASGRPAAHVAAEMGVSRTTAYRWWRRYQVEGEAGLYDRPSPPHRCPHQTPAELEEQILGLRRLEKLGPARIGLILGMPSSTVWRVLARHGLNRLAWMDRPTGRVIRRYEKNTPGELIHIDIKSWVVSPTGADGGLSVSRRAVETVSDIDATTEPAPEETSSATDTSTPRSTTTPVSPTSKS